MKLENQNSILFSDDARDEVATALSNLKRVDAPGDFDFKLRARIAQSEPAQVRRTGMLLAAKFALPVVVLLGFGAFLIVSNGDGPAVSGVPQMVDQPVQSAPTGETELPAAGDGGVASATSPASPAGNNQTNRSSNSKGAIDQLLPAGGSVDSAIEPESALLPRGFDSNPKIDPGSIQSNSQFSVNDLLSMIGANGEFTGGGFLVRSVSVNSVAARAGLRGGDMIEAINDKAINAQTVFRGAFSGKNIRISRDGRRMSLNLGS